jgi:hypothetical protein
MAAVCFLVMGKTAGAQGSEAVIASVPVDRVIGVITMFAGGYTVMRVSRNVHSPLEITSQKSSALALPIVIDNVSAAQSAALDRERIGDRYILGRVDAHWTTVTCLPRSINRTV